MATDNKEAKKLEKEMEFFCKTLAIIGGKPNKETVKQCMLDLDKFLADENGLKAFDDKYINIFDKDTLEKTYAIVNIKRETEK